MRLRGDEPWRGDRGPMQRRPAFAMARNGFPLGRHFACKGTQVWKQQSDEGRGGWRGTCTMTADRRRKAYPIGNAHRTHRDAQNAQEGAPRAAVRRWTSREEHNARHPKVTVLKGASRCVDMCADVLLYGCDLASTTWRHENAQRGAHPRISVQS